LGLARIDVKVDVKARVRLLVFDNTEVTASSPESKGFWVSVFHTLKVTTSLFILAFVN
jgi:hypothetical protein